MNTADDSREMKILGSKGILIKDQPYHVVLTNRRIILTSYADNKPRSIAIREIQKTELGSDDSGDPVIIIFLPSAAGETKKVILHFSQKNFPDPQQVSSLWSSEINKTIASPVPVSPDTIPKKVSGAPAFCVKCGTKFTDGSVFCNKCGTKIIYPAQPLPMDQSDVSVQEKIVTSPISPVPGKTSPKKISSPIAGDSNTKEKVPVIASPRKEPPKKKSFFAGSGKQKPAIIAVSALVGIIVLIAAFFVVVPSGLPGLNFTSPGMNFTVPEVEIATASPSNQVVSLTTTPMATYAPEIPEQTPIPEVPFSKPAITSVPGGPSSVLDSYPSLFNSGNAVGLEAISSENLKSYSPIVKTELAAARSNNIIIDKIQVTNQIIEKNDAILDVDILWEVAGSPVTSSPRFFLVHQDNQWKLDSLVLNPDVS